ncbi:serine/threonine dehydratase [Nocardia pseudobrasiliensis]|uniref:Threonine dehydratase n=1 Tax=Nocardia pseudobrasiliensis TaxID=45979 RepID=A0A370I5A8_9NOCA|nr:serine/threonine dehydratase [Nocardia pseudobrasiliensis]RDI65895.1 threonine dehydratase [Nocardia pseudobrasiliensis]
MYQLAYAEIEAATDRIARFIRPVTVSEFCLRPGSSQDRAPSRIWIAHEYLQYTGTFKARGAANFVMSHKAASTLPAKGVTIASGGNAGVACAWSTTHVGIPTTVFVPDNAPGVKVAKLRALGADVRQVGTQYADAAAACVEFAADTGALLSHAYDHPLIAAGAGTLLEEIRTAIPRLDTVIVAVGGGGLFTGVATAAAQYGIRTVAVEPRHCRALHAAVESDALVDVDIDSVAADSLGARRVSQMALTAAKVFDVQSVLVDDSEIIRTRRALWENYRIVVEAGAAAALAAITGEAPAYSPGVGENVCVVLCGANTDPSDLVL